MERGRKRRKEKERGAREPDNWQRVKAACTARQAAQLELKAALRHNEDVAANQHMGGAKQVGALKKLRGKVIIGE